MPHQRRKTIAAPLRHAISCLFGGAALSAPAIASAQDQQPAPVPANSGQASGEQDLQPITVPERQARRDRSRGVEVGGVRLYPTADVRIAYDSNVFAAPVAQGDASVMLAGKIVGEVATSDASARFQAGVDRLQYARFTSENATQWQLGLDSDLQLPANLKLHSETRYEQRVEPRTSSGAPLAAGRPVRYRVASSEADLEWQGARLRAALGGEVAGFDYRDVEIGGITLDQQLRDYRYTEIRGRIGYDVDGDRQLFVRVDRHWGDYLRPQPVTGANRDTRGVQATVGIASAITPLVRGTASIGYLHESFAIRSAAPVSALAFNTSLDWLVTPITTVHVDASRRLENSASLDSTGYLASRVALRIDHELTRSTLLDLTATQERAEFRSIDRSDSVYGLAFGVRRQVSSELYARARGLYQWRDSGGVARGFDFAQSLVSLDVGYNF